MSNRPITSKTAREQLDTEILGTIANSSISTLRGDAELALIHRVTRAAAKASLKRLVQAEKITRERLGSFSTMSFYRATGR